MATIFYYPEGPLGPVCDIVVDDVVAIELGIDVGDGKVDTYGPIDLDDLERITDDTARYIKTRRCKQRTLSDGRIEYYDCINDLNAPIAAPPGYPLIEPQYNWPVESTSPWGLDDDFEGLQLTPESCFPHDPDINVFPVKFYNADGTFVEKIQVEKSSPVTFPVDSLVGYDIVEGSISATFVESGGNVLLRATGTGTGNIGLRFEWHDDPNAHGTATSAVSVRGVTFNQSGTSGNQNATIEVTAGVDYPVTIVGGTGYGGYSVTSDKICFRDLHENDCNASLIIGSTTNETTIENKGAWSDDGNAYAVWVNPEVCTLPTIQQTVTYFIDIPATDTYTITGGADDFFEVFLNNDATPIIDGGAGIFNEQHEIVHTGSYTPPYSVTQTLQAGTLKLIVKCTNGSTENDAEGKPTGNAFIWNMNPGGWYIKICRGDSCITPTVITGWVKAGPHQGWANFMNTYAVYPSNNDPLKGIDHTVTWSINVPSAGDYTFEYAVDNTGTWELDGTQIVTAVDNFSGSSTYTITNLSAGPHTITGTVNNNSGDADTWTENPAGIAWTLTPAAGGAIIASSLDLETGGDGNLIWHTRMDAGYEWVEI